MVVVRNLAANAGDKRCGFSPWVGKVPCRRKWQPTRLLAWRIPWTEESGGIQSMGPDTLRDWAHQICSLSNFLCVQIYFLYSEMIHIRTNQRERHTRIGRELEGLKFIALCTVPVNLGHLALPTHLQKALPIWMLTHLQGPQLLLGFHYIGLTDLSLAP